VIVADNDWEMQKIFFHRGSIDAEGERIEEPDETDSILNRFEKQIKQAVHEIMDYWVSELSEHSPGEELFWDTESWYRLNGDNCKVVASGLDGLVIMHILSERKH